MTIIRQQGQLSQSDPNDQSTQDLASQQGMPVAPTTPAGTAATGASPDQAKMAGTPVQKAAVLDTQSKPQDTLQNAESLQQARDKPTDVETAAKDKATQLQSLGSLNVRVQALVQQKLSPTAAAGPELDDTKIQALTPDLDKQAQAKAALDAVMKNPGDAQKVADAANLFAANHWGTIDNMLPQNYLATAQQTLGDQFKNAEPVTLEHLNLAPNESAELDSVFGGDTWKAFTPEQLGQKIEDLRQAEFNKVQGLKAQMATATGGQRQVLARELQDAAGTGQTGVEAGVKSLADSVKAADTVKIGNDQVKVEDLLKDGAVSDLIGRMINDPALMDKVGTQHPELVAWVKQNQSSLADLAKNIGDTTSKVKDTNTATKALANYAGGTLSDTVMKSLLPDWGKVGSTVPDTSKNAVLSVLKAATPADQKSMGTGLELLAEQDPDKLKALSNSGADGVSASWAAGQSLKNDASSMYSQMFPDIDQKSGFITDPAQLKAMAAAKPVVDALNAELKVNPKLVDVLNDGTGAIADMIKKGQFSTTDVKLLSQHPEALKAYQDHSILTTKLDALTKVKDVQGVVDLLFGTQTDLAALQKQYDTAKQWAALDPNSPAAAKLKQFQANLDLNKDGKIDSGDMASIVKGLRDQSGGTQNFENFLASEASGKVPAKSEDTAIEKTLRGTDFNTPLDPSKDTFFTMMQGFLNSKETTTQKMADLEKAGMLDRVGHLSTQQIKDYGLTSISKYTAAQGTTKTTDATKVATDAISNLWDSAGINRTSGTNPASYFNSWSNAASDPQAMWNAYATTNPQQREKLKNALPQQILNLTNAAAASPEAAAALKSQIKTLNNVYAIMDTFVTNDKKGLSMKWADNKTLQWS